MTTNDDDATMLGLLGDALSWSLERALRVYERAHPEDAPTVRAALASGAMRWKLTVTGGGRADATILAEALDHDGNARLIAAQSIRPTDLN
jgi:hypothetical protein